VCSPSRRVGLRRLRRKRRRLKRLQYRYRKHRITMQTLTQSIQSWGAHLKHADGWHLRQDIFTLLVFTRAKEGDRAHRSKMVG